MLVAVRVNDRVNPNQIVITARECGVVIHSVASVCLSVLFGL